MIGIMPRVLPGLSSVSGTRYRAGMLVGVLKSPCHEFFPGEVTKLV